jgi:hypothetical protein
MTQLIIKEIGGAKILDNKHKPNVPPEDYKAKSKGLIERINESEFVCDKPILYYATNPFLEIIAGNPSLSEKKFFLCVSKNPTYNASSIAQNFIIINAGLLALIRTKEEYYFVLAHEIAHIILGHGDEMQIRHDEMNKQLEDDKIKSALKKSVDKRESLLSYLEGIQMEERAFSRKQEYEADSMAMIFLRPILEYPEMAISALQHLDEYAVPEVDWATILNFEEMPFKESWIQIPEPLVQPDSTDKKKIDLFRTHPHAKERLEKLRHDQKENSNSSGSEYKLNQQQINILVRESVEFLIAKENYVDALYYGFLSSPTNPDHHTISILMSRVFLKLYELRAEHNFNKFIPLTPVKLYSSYEKLICMLNTLRTTELLSLGYQYLLHSDAVKDELFTGLKNDYEKYINK